MVGGLGDPPGDAQSGQVNRTGNQRELPPENPLGIVDAAVDRLLSPVCVLSRVTVLPAALAE